MINTLAVHFIVKLTKWKNMIKSSDMIKQLLLVCYYFNIIIIN